MVDIQIIVSTYGYKPVAFSKLVHPWARSFFLVMGFLSLATTLIAYVFCLLVFGGFEPSLRGPLFVLFLVKAITWSPFIGLEYYDMLLEQIYHDVQFQLNVIKPYNNSKA